MPVKRKSTEKEQYQQARSLETEKRFQDAAIAYEKIITMHPFNLDAQNRLMVVYRKLKEGKKEVRTITRAIKSYQGKIESDQKQWIKSNREKAEISKQLASSLGMLSDKGLPLYENEILSKWKTRLSLLKDRLAKAALKDNKSTSKNPKRN